MGEPLTEPTWSLRRSGVFCVCHIGRIVGVLFLVGTVAVVIGGCGASRPTSATSATYVPDILSASTRVARTSDGAVGYREIGKGSPVVLITGFSASMDNWPPSFVDALAVRHEVLLLDNAGVGSTAALRSTTIDSMADQTKALLDYLNIRGATLLGWSMGGMIAQVLAVEDRHQVRRLVLCATQAGTGGSARVPPAAQAKAASSNPAVVLSVLFPADQSRASQSYVKAILEYPHFYLAPSPVKSAQTRAIDAWFAGDDPPAQKLGSVSVPTLVADGTEDALDPSSNDRLLASLIHGSKLILYPDAGHGFLFQDESKFLPALEQFLGSG